MVGVSYLRMPYSNGQEEIMVNYIQIPTIAHFNLSKGPIVPMLGLGCTPSPPLPNFESAFFLNLMAGCYIGDLVVSGLFGFNGDLEKTFNFRLGYTF